ncbi:peptide ABC transporter substrate-binding protein [Candidatus Saccharibacteria bacterium oral taxon 488]|nr:peptide ABC transporter substrate-binding protein [Candidatus Saccharibacteria bacterium oral taxon 488]
MDTKKSSWKKFLRLDFATKDLDGQAQKLTKTTLRHTHMFISSRLEHLAGVKRHVLGWIFLVILLITISMVQWLSFRELYAHNAPARGGSYSEGVLGPLETLNPIFARSSAEKSAARLMFASLYNYDTTGHIKGDLAESVTVNEAETEYTVKLRRNLKWSDGAPLDARDVVFTVNLLKDARTQSSITGWQSINVKQVDERTVQFTLPAPYAPFMHALTFPILPQHSLSEVNPAELREHGYGKSPVTSGPFAMRILQNANADGSKKVLHLVANSQYHHGAPKLDRFQLYVYPTRDEITKGLKTSEIMATPELSYMAQSDQIRHMYASRSYAINDGVYALFNTQSEVVSSRKVRQALVQSINTQALREKFAFAKKPLHGPIFDDQVDGQLAGRLPYDTEAAKKLLDEEGWKVVGNQRKKGEQVLQLSFVTLKGSDFESIARELVKVWQETLHITVDLRVVDPNDASQNVLQSVLRPRGFDVLLYELVLGGDADVFAYWHSSQANQSGLNFANYNSAVADDALAAGRTKQSAKQRVSKYQAFTKHWQSDVPALALYQVQLDYIHLRSVSALGESVRLVYPTDRFADVIYWTVRQDSVYKTP